MLTTSVVAMAVAGADSWVKSSADSCSDAGTLHRSRKRQGSDNRAAADSLVGAAVAAAGAAVAVVAAAGGRNWFLQRVAPHFGSSQRIG